MGSDYATEKHRRKGIEPMGTPARAPDASKLLAMADKVAVRNQVYKRARQTGAELREYGRLNKSIHDLTETAEQLRKAGGQP